ncbi:hypothetical protein EDC94DRAFT_581654 [Helicostylum pulchrum]|nr:hypothetical protein EDC94DRAFT_581654 [Helicostylum pulchrum]
MQQDVKIEVSSQNLEIDRSRTRAYIKQETEDSKEYLKSALYQPVKIKSRSLDISKYKTIGNKHCSICNINFRFVNYFLDHELHSHKTKEAPIIDLKIFCCNICNRLFKNTVSYCEHMAGLNNIHVPYIRPRLENPNNHCQAYQYCDVCDKTYDTIKISYVRHLVQFHGITLPGPSDIIQNMDDNPFLFLFIIVWIIKITAVSRVIELTQLYVIIDFIWLQPIMRTNKIQIKSCIV